MANTNQRAMPRDIGIPGFWLTGDTTWPGVGTVACVLSSRIVAREAMKAYQRLARRMPYPVTVSPDVVQET